MKAPTGLKASVMVIVSASSASVLWKSLAIAVNANTTRKKSNASRVQPRKLATTAERCPRVSRSPEDASIEPVPGIRQYARKPMHVECLVKPVAPELSCRHEKSSFWFRNRADASLQRFGGEPASCRSAAGEHRRDQDRVRQRRRHSAHRRQIARHRHRRRDALRD